MGPEPLFCAGTILLSWTLGTQAEGIETACLKVRNSAVPQYVIPPTAVEQKLHRAKSL
jgi:hypothetical protein